MRGTPRRGALVGKATQRARLLWLAPPLVAVVVLASCTSSGTPTSASDPDETTVAVNASSEATLQMPGGASVAVPAGAVSGSGELVGSVLASPPTPAAGLP